MDYKYISSIKKFNSNITTSNILEVSNVLNKHFATVVQKIASKLNSPSISFTSFLKKPVNESLFFNNVTCLEVENHISQIPENKSYGLYS